MPVAPSKDFLTQKAGILPVWGWGAIGLGAAYAYSRYKANQAAAQGNGTTSTTNAAGESTASAPQFIIENQEPNNPSSISVPVTVNNPAPVPVTTPPGTTTQPPTNQPPLQGQPVGSPVGPVPVGAPPTTTAPAKPTAPAAPKYTVYKVQSGDTLSSIAAKYHTTWQALWSFNTGSSSPRTASAKATLLKRGPNLLYSGEEIYIPS